MVNEAAGARRRSARRQGAGADRHHARSGDAPSRARAASPPASPWSAPSPTWCRWCRRSPAPWRRPTTTRTSPSISTCRPRRAFAASGRTWRRWSATWSTTPASGRASRVSIEVLLEQPEPGRDSVRIVVDDDGPGLTPAQREQVARARPAARRDQAGLGARALDRGGACRPLRRRAQSRHRADRGLAGGAGAAGGVSVTVPAAFDHISIREIARSRQSVEHSVRPCSIGERGEMARRRTRSRCTPGCAHREPSIRRVVSVRLRNHTKPVAGEPLVRSVASKRNIHSRWRYEMRAVDSGRNVRIMEAAAMQNCAAEGASNQRRDEPMQLALQRSQAEAHRGSALLVAGHCVDGADSHRQNHLGSAQAHDRSASVTFRAESLAAFGRDVKARTWRRACAAERRHR